MPQTQVYIGTIKTKPPVRNPGTNTLLLQKMKRFLQDTEKLRERNDDILRQRQAEAVAEQLDFS